MRRKVLYTLILLVISLISIFMMTACNSRNYETNTYEVNEDLRVFIEDIKQNRKRNYHLTYNESKLIKVEITGENQK